MFDLIIIGGGPAGSAAAVYAARKQLKTLLITEEFGGQSVVSESIENWVGTVAISGMDLAKSLEGHVAAYADDWVTVAKSERVANVSKTEEGFLVTTESEKEFTSQTVLVTTGSHRRKLPVPGADEFEHKGLTYCATCDGPLFKDKDVVVIGGGNAGFESAAQLLAYAKSVTLLHRSENYRADPVTVEKVLSHQNMTGVLNAQTKAVTGDVFVTGLTYTDAGGEDHALDVSGIFVEIGLIPSTSYVKDLVDLTDNGQVIIDPWTQRSSIDGIWAAGDCTNILYHQNNIAAGDAVKALEDIYKFLRA